MKDYTKEEMIQIYKNRRSKLADYLKKNEIGACVFIDSEEHRDPNIAYYTNQPSDAVLIIFSDAYTVLIAWDENLAKQNACYDRLVPYSRYKNNKLEATKALLNVCCIHGENAKVELYNLQGIRITNPQEGQFYIKRQGNKVSKLIF